MRLLNSPPDFRGRGVFRMALLVSVMVLSFQSLAQGQEKERPVAHPTVYRTIQVDG